MIFSRTRSTQHLAFVTSLPYLGGWVCEELVAEARLWSQTHTRPRWFHALRARDDWTKNNMPRYDLTFRTQPITGTLDSAAKKQSKR